MKAFIVDSFTNEAFKGNPAGVCIVEKDLTENVMLSIAQEFNLSETAFIQKMQYDTHYSIRYFSPKMEIPLCGHATLASAKVLFSKLNIQKVTFVNIQDLHLQIHQVGNEIEMRFPSYGTQDAKVPKALLAALGLETFVNSVYNEETQILMIEIKDPVLLQNLNPDFHALYHSHQSINGVLVTAPADNNKYDFHSRYFWPWSGTNEDPVTGGTHTFLAPYWGNILNKTIMKSYQSSARSGFMEVELKRASNVLIRSQAVIVFEGTLHVGNGLESS